jgi:hypothetical protein
MATKAHDGQRVTVVQQSTHRFYSAHSLDFYGNWLGSGRWVDNIQLAAALRTVAVLF